VNGIGQLIGTRRPIATFNSANELQDVINGSTPQQACDQLSVSRTTATHETEVGQNILLNLKMDLWWANPTRFKNETLQFRVFTHIGTNSTRGSWCSSARCVRVEPDWWPSWN
jgi:hypothetical protein